MYNDELGIAGTVDLLTYDKDGNIRIYDMKSMRGNNFKESYKGDTANKYESTRYGKSKKQKHTEQISLYRILLNNTHGLLAKTIGVMPLEISYNAGDTTTTKLNLLKGVQLTALDKVETAELATQKPVAPVSAKKADKPVINIYWGSPESSTNTKELSNLAPRKFTYQGKEYGSVEHAYQTLKSGSFDEVTYDKYVKAGGYGTKIRGKAVQQGFDNLQLMKDLVVESFKQNPDKAQLLLKYSDFTHTTNEVIDKAFLDGVRLAQKNAELAALAQPSYTILSDSEKFDLGAYIVRLQILNDGNMEKTVNNWLEALSEQDPNLSKGSFNNMLDQVLTNPFVKKDANEVIEYTRELGNKWFDNFSPPAGDDVITDAIPAPTVTQPAPAAPSEEKVVEITGAEDTSGTFGRLGIPTERPKALAPDVKPAPVSIWPSEEEKKAAGLDNSYDLLGIKPENVGSVETFATMALRNQQQAKQDEENCIGNSPAPF